MKKLNPAEYVIEQFGGIRQTAKIVGRAPSAVCRWRKRKRVPTSACKKILTVAKKMGLPITAENLIMGS